MNTITAKELRDNLGAIAKRVQRGEHIRVTYRDKVAFTISPEVSKLPEKRLEGLKAFLNAPKQPSPFDSHKSVKELYREHLEEKYGAR